MRRSDASSVVARVALALAVALGLAPVAAHAEPAAEDVAAARAAAQALGGALKAQLLAAVETGGAASAIGVCREIAPATAALTSDDAGFSVGRTALRVRNPANAPDGLEQDWLEAFAAALDAGAEPATLERAAVVMEDGRPVFRWMAPIMMGGLCAQCHGEAIAPDVAAAIAALYPEDEAVGFAPGALRGAFTVRAPREAD